MTKTDLESRIQFLRKILDDKRSISDYGNTQLEHFSKELLLLTECDIRQIVKEPRYAQIT